MPDYLLYFAYGLVALGVIGCLGFVAKSFEDEDVETSGADPER